MHCVFMCICMHAYMHVVGTCVSYCRLNYVWPNVLTTCCSNHCMYACMHTQRYSLVPRPILSKKNGREKKSVYLGRVGWLEFSLNWMLFQQYTVYDSNSHTHIIPTTPRYNQYQASFSPVCYWPGNEASTSCVVCMCISIHVHVS